MNRKLMRFGRRLLSDTGGQVLFFAIAVLVALFAFMLAIPNVGYVTAQRMRMQTAADAGAFTASNWISRQLNLNADMNTGIRSMYLWMTTLTASEALALALDSIKGTQDVASAMTTALFGNPDPKSAATNDYPQAIRQLAATASWLTGLQSSFSYSGFFFDWMAVRAGSMEIYRNLHNGQRTWYWLFWPSNGNPDGNVLINNGQFPALVSDTSRLMLGDMNQLAGALSTRIPKPLSDTSNVRTPTGTITINPSTYEIRAKYSLPSRWSTLVQKDSFYNTTTKVYLDSTFTVSNYTDMTDAAKWRRDSSHYWGPPYYPSPGESLCARALNLKNRGYSVIVQKSSFTFSWVTTTASESTNGQQGSTVYLPRRFDPSVRLWAASYAWYLDSNQSPYGLKPAIAGFLFPGNRVSAPSPVLAVARSSPCLTKLNPAKEDSFFSPTWNVQLTPLDSAGAAQICSDGAYGSHNLSSFNLVNLRRYVLLP